MSFLKDMSDSVPPKLHRISLTITFTVAIVGLIWNAHNLLKVIL